MNSLTPYFNYKIAARLLLLHIFLVIIVGSFGELQGLSENFLFQWASYGLLAFINLYIWAAFWKLVVYEHGEFQMNPYFLLVAIAVVLEDDE